MAWPTPGVERLIDAMTTAEGGPDAMVRAVRISVPLCDSYAGERVIAANSIAHAMWDFIARDFPIPPSPVGASGLSDFLVFLGSRWAPVGAANDPNGLNANWVANVIADYRKGGGVV
jgi:hypothetical protein